MVSVNPARRCTSLLGVVPVGSGDGVGDCQDAANFLEKWLFISLVFIFGEKTLLFFQGKVFYYCFLYRWIC